MAYLLIINQVITYAFYIMLKIKNFSVHYNDLFVILTLTNYLLPFIYSIFLNFFFPLGYIIITSKVFNKRNQVFHLENHILNIFLSFFF